MSESHRILINHINFEIKQIEKLFAKYKTLFTFDVNKAPNDIEIAALGSLLHSFYNGIENIFLQIGKMIDDYKPVGTKWHKELLEHMNHKTEYRKEVITGEIKEKLLNYLGFRHVFRHSYTYFIEWEKIKDLIEPLNVLWDELKNNLIEFIVSLDK